MNWKVLNNYKINSLLLGRWSKSVFSLWSNRAAHLLKKSKGLFMGHSTFLAKNGQKCAKSATFSPKFILPFFLLRKLIPCDCIWKWKLFWALNYQKNSLIHDSVMEMIQNFWDLLGKKASYFSDNCHTNSTIVIETGWSMHWLLHNINHWKKVGKLLDSLFGGHNLPPGWDKVNWVG